MTTEQAINQVYSDVCVKLGDITQKKQKLDAEHADLIAQVRALEALAAKTKAAEAAAKVANVKVEETIKADSDN